MTKQEAMIACTIGWWRMGAKPELITKKTGVSVNDVVIIIDWYKKKLAGRI